MADDEKRTEPTEGNGEDWRTKLPEWMHAATDKIAGVTFVGGWPVDPETLLPIGLRADDTPERPDEPEPPSTPVDAPSEPPGA
jgi:hypothetical protein